MPISVSSRVTTISNSKQHFKTTQMNHSIRKSAMDLNKIYFWTATINQCLVACPHAPRLYLIANNTSKQLK